MLFENDIEMVGRLSIGKINFTFVFRIKWDNEDGLKYNSEFRDYRIGLWFRRKKIVGSKNFNKPKEWGNNLVNDYMFGVNLIICKAWVSFNRGGKSLKVFKKITNNKKLIIMKKCENCKFYSHTANILGGIAECMKNVKILNTFGANDACNKFEITNDDKLKEQNDFYKEHLGGAIKIGNRGIELT